MGGTYVWVIFFTADGSRSHYFTPIQPRTEYYWKLFSESENCIKTEAISKHCKVKSAGCHWTSLTRDHNSWFERILCCNGMFKCAVNIIYLMFSWQVEFWLVTRYLQNFREAVRWQKIINRSHLCAVHLHCAQQTTHISQDDRKSIIALCDLCPKIHVFMFFL